MVDEGKGRLNPAVTPASAYVRPFRAPIWCHGALSRRAWHSQSGGYTPDSAKAEGSSIVDEPEEG